LTASGQAQAYDIDDCVNDVYLALMGKLQQYNESRGSLGAFIAVIARSTALHYLRDNRHKIDELIGDDRLNLLHGYLDVENKVEFQMLIDNILDKLNEQENALFVLRYILFYSPEEIAKSLKIKRNAVYVRINRLKKKIKNFLIKGGIML
jgi:RNA polymerase sigma-70 factor (ECF subfamily)